MAYCTDRDQQALQAPIRAPRASRDKQRHSGSSLSSSRTFDRRRVRAGARADAHVSLGFIRSMHDDYGAEFAAHSDSATFQTIGICVFLRTVARDGAEAPAGNGQARYVERVGNAYRVTNKVNVPDPIFSEEIKKLVSQT